MAIFKLFLNFGNNLVPHIVVITNFKKASKVEKKININKASKKQQRNEIKCH